MNINYIGKKTTIRESFKEYANKKISKLEKFFNDNATATVIVTNESNEETVEVTIKSHGMFFRAEKTTNDRIISLDLVMDILVKQIVRNKQRLEKRFKYSIPKDTPFDMVLEDEKELSESDKLVKTKRFFVDMMTVDEAILQMNMLGHEFFMFRNSEDGVINVIYRRNDGNYGLLMPIQ